MTSPTRFSSSEHRLGGERRRGGDSRTPEERRRQGERRGGVEAGRDRARLTPRAATWLHISLTAAILTFVDAQFFQGAHSVQLAVEGGAYASSLASRWISSGFRP